MHSDATRRDWKVFTFIYGCVTSIDEKRELPNEKERDFAMRETKGTGGLVDADNDGLDDRLVDSSVTNEVGILAILHRLDRMQLHELEQETLEKMFQDLKERQDVLLEVAKDLERSVHKQISEGQYNTLRMMRKKIRVLNKKYQEIEEEKEKTNNI